jgi:hypothetical protein
MRFTSMPSPDLPVDMQPHKLASECGAAHAGQSPEAASPGLDSIQKACCTASEPVCCGSGCITLEKAALSLCPAKNDCCTPDPPTAPCCTKAKPVCCGSSCITRKLATRVRCRAPRPTRCCAPPKPVCCTERQYCCNGKCLDYIPFLPCEDTTSCCDKPTDAPPPWPIDKCCTSDKPSCNCGACGDPVPPGVAILCSAGSPATCCSDAPVSDAEPAVE